MTTPETVAAGKVVTLHYRLSLHDGELIDASEEEMPLSYLHGQGQLVPGLERELDGRAPGDKLAVKVSPEDGYGPVDDDAVQVVERSAFPDDMELEEGLSFHAVDEDDNTIMGTITSIVDQAVTVDFNHPLAGKELHFEIEITGVRDASDEEREHGHAHGADGHEEHEDDFDEEDDDEDDASEEE